MGDMFYSRSLDKLRKFAQDGKPEFVSYALEYDDEVVTGITINMMWMGHALSYSYEFSGHGDPMLQIDGSFDWAWDDLPIMFNMSEVSEDPADVWEKISDAAASYTPSDLDVGGAEL